MHIQELRVKDNSTARNSGLQTIWNLGISYFLPFRVSQHSSKSINFCPFVTQVTNEKLIVCTSLKSNWQEYHSQLLNVLLTGDFCILHFIGIKTKFTFLNLYNVNLMFVSKQTSVIFIEYAKGRSHSFTPHHQDLEILAGFFWVLFFLLQKVFEVIFACIKTTLNFHVTRLGPDLAVSRKKENLTNCCIGETYLKDCNKDVLKLTILHFLWLSLGSRSESNFQDSTLGKCIICYFYDIFLLTGNTVKVFIQVNTWYTELIASTESKYS